jgi:hypothetical protein
VGELEHARQRAAVVRHAVVDAGRDGGATVQGPGRRRGVDELRRISNGSEGLYSYNLCCVSERDYQKMQGLHCAYFRQLRAIVAESTPSERVVLANLQLFALGR